ncbi:4-phosphoerythronate dehydrogenase [Rhodocaloribacter sp.]
MPRSSLLIVADENIPFVREAFGSFGEVRLVPGREIVGAHVREADALLVRSVTRVDRALLGGSAVRFVGTATIGTDHVDRSWLRAHGVAFAHAPGSNATSVVEYVVAALFRLSVRRGRELRGRTVGIVGCGHIGGRLARRLPALGVRVLRNDPPRAEAAERRGEPHPFVPLDALLAAADVVTLHVPLTREGPHATRGLIGAEALRRMRPGAWLVNTARGPVVSNAALLDALATGRPGAAVLDVWEGEPNPDPELIRRVDLGTPHIAGYSYDGKVRGTVMLYRAFIGHFGLPDVWEAERAFAAGPGDRLRLRPPEGALPETEWLDAVARQMYDLEADDRRFRRILTVPPEERGAYFSRLRKTYPRRRAFTRHVIAEKDVPPAFREALTDGLGVRLV